MLNKEQCKRCIESVPDSFWKRVHKVLGSTWTDKDEWFWNQDGTVRCFYGDSGRAEDKKIDGDAPIRCPYRLENIVLGQDEDANAKC